MSDAREELMALIDAADENPKYTRDIADAIIANPDMVLRALGGTRLDLHHGPLWSFPMSDQRQDG